MKKTAALIIWMLTLTACGQKAQDSTIQGNDQSIVGGEEVLAEDPIAASTVAIAHRFAGVFCSGTLIAKNLVVTAAHCTQPIPWDDDPTNLVIVFSRDLTSESAEGRRVLGGRVPPAWVNLNGVEVPEKNWGDIAVLRFQGTAPEGFKPATLLRNVSSLSEGQDVVLAGYGRTTMQGNGDTDVLLKTTVKLSERDFSQTEIKFEQHEGRGACHGDSGGPSYATVKGKLVLIGVTSRAATEQGGATCLEGSIYTSVPAYIDFMVQSAKEMNSPEFKVGEPIPGPRM